MATDLVELFKLSGIECMRVIPSDFDFKCLDGCSLTMVGFGPCTIGLNFSRPQPDIGGHVYSVVFNIEGGISYEMHGAKGHRISTDSTTSAPLLDFLTIDVKQMTLVGQASLKITFESEDFILIHGDNHGFEAYTIFLDSGDVIVI